VDTIRIRRKAGADLITFSAAGSHEFVFDGTGPWDVPVATWSALSSCAGEFFEPLPSQGADVPEEE